MIRFPHEIIGTTFYKACREQIVAIVSDTNYRQIFLTVLLAQPGNKLGRRLILNITVNKHQFNVTVFIEEGLCLSGGGTFIGNEVMPAQQGCHRGALIAFGINNQHTGGFVFLKPAYQAHEVIKNLRVFFGNIIYYIP